MYLYLVSSSVFVVRPAPVPRFTRELFIAFGAYGPSFILSNPSTFDCPVFLPFGLAAKTD